MRTEFTNQSTGPISFSLLKTALLFIAAIYGLNFLILGSLMSPFDYDALATFYEIAWRYWRYGSGFPHFNPLLCGGRPLIADPQTPIFHPILLLVPILGAVSTVKVELLIQLGLGVGGLLSIFKRWNLGAAEKCWGILCYLCGGAVVSRFMVGHVTLGYYLFLPLLLYFSYQCHDGPRSAGWLLRYWLLVAYAFLHKPNFLIQVVPLLFIEVAIRSLVVRKWRPILHFCLAVTVGGLLNAVTYLPAREYFLIYPRSVDGIPNSTPFYTLLLNLIFPIKTLPEKWYGPHYMGRFEYNIFLGAVPVLLALFGIKRAFKEQRPEWLSLFILGVFSAILGCGSDSGTLSFLSPYSWFYHFWPGFQSIRVPPRFWYGVFLCTLVFSAIGFRTQLPGKRWFWTAITILPLLLNAAINLSKVTVQSSGTQSQFPANYLADFQWTTTKVDRNFGAIRQGLGVLNCHANMNIPSAKLNEGPMLPKLEGVKLDWIRWHRIGIEAVPPFQSLMTLQLNHSPFWKFKGQGAEILSKDFEPLRLSLSGALIQGELVYEAPGFWEGLILSLSTAVIMLLFLSAKLVYDARHV